MQRKVLLHEFQISKSVQLKENVAQTDSGDNEIRESLEKKIKLVGCFGRNAASGDIFYDAAFLYRERVICNDMTVQLVILQLGNIYIFFS